MDNIIPHQMKPLLFGNSIIPVKGNEAQYDVLTTHLKDLIDKQVDLSLPILKSLYPEKEFNKLIRAKERILNEAEFVYHTQLKLAPNQTNDEGNIRPQTEGMLKNYGLRDCQMTQLAILKENNGKLVLNLYLAPILYLDDLNLKALLWHEILYLLEPDQHSARIRALVSVILASEN